MKTLQINKPLQKKRYSIIIPAAGSGYRMKAYGPKCLLDINGISLIEYQMQKIADILNRFEVILVAGFQYAEIRNKFKQTRNFKIVRNYDFETTNVAASINVGLQSAQHDDVILIYGDLLFNVHAITAPFGHQSVIVVDENNGLMGKDEVGVISHQHKVTNLMYNLPQKWAQIAYFMGNELSLLRTITANEESKNKFGFEVINNIIDSGGNFRSFCPKKIKVFDIDSSQDLEKIRLIK